MERIDEILSYNESADKERLVSVFNFVKDRHKTIGVDIATSFRTLDVLLKLHPDDDGIISALLVDLYLSGEIGDGEVTKKFGNNVLSILHGIKRLEALKYEENDKAAQIGVFRKLFLSMAKDLRVVLIVLAYQLARMEALDGNSDEIEGREFIAKKCMDLCIPVASRLGVYNIKTAMEELYFKFMYPKEYDDISAQLKRFLKKERPVIDTIKDQLESFLVDRGYEGIEISGRLKNPYSVYRKIQRKGLTKADELYDIFAMRIVLPTRYDDRGEESVDHLYGVLGLIHSEWRPISKRFKDYVAVPKPNGYRSLHTVILGLGPKDMDKPVEIQIRSADMHRDAEYGVSSHWLYKDVGRKQFDLKSVRSHSDWLKGLEKYAAHKEKNSGVMEEAELDIFGDRIFVLTPRGEVKDLPSGATPIDFAYAVHTDIGNRCLMAKVDGNIVSLDHELQNGDVVEIVTRKESAPKLQWLSIVKTDSAKSKIKGWFSGLNKEANIKEGRSILNRHLERLGKPQLDNKFSILKNFAGQVLNFSQRERLVVEVGKGAQLPGDIIRNVFSGRDFAGRGVGGDSARKKSNKQVRAELVDSLSLEKRVRVGGETGLPIKLASCCKAKAGVPIVGYVTRGKRITIHRLSCPLLEGLDRSRLVSADWNAGAVDGGEKYYVKIRLSVVSRVGLIRDISAIISSFGLSISDMSVKCSTGSGTHEDCFVLEVDDPEKIDALLVRLERVEGVLGVVRED